MLNTEVGFSSLHIDSFLSITINHLVNFVSKCMHILNHIDYFCPEDGCSVIRYSTIYVHFKCFFFCVWFEVKWRTHINVNDIGHN